MKIPSKFLVLALAIGVPSIAPFARAGTVANWKQLNGGATIPLAGADTDAPIFGDGSASSAQSTWAAGRFGTVASPESVALEVGQTLTISGNLLLTGGKLSPDGQYRFGAYNDGGKFDAGSGTEWAGGWMHNVNVDLFQASTTAAFISGGGAVDLNAIKTTTGTFDGDSPTAPYQFSMSITRDSATTVDVVSSFTGGDGALDQTYTGDDITTDVFTYTAIGWLMGGTSTLDQAEFSNVQYSVSPEPDTAPLRITKITREEIVDPGNVIVSLTFTSDENKLYTIYRSDGFEDPVETRIDVNDNISGETGAETTTFPIDFNFHGIPLDTPAQFFVVKENASATP